MAKRFNIHEWQAGRYSKKPLTEGKGSTLSISKSDMEKLHKDGKIVVDGHIVLYKIEEDINEQESEYELSDEEKDSLTDMTNGFVRKLTDVRGGNYSGDRLLAALQFVQLVIQDAEPMLYNDEDELDEASITGTGASFNAGVGMGHFGNATKKKRKKQ